MYAARAEGGRFLQGGTGVMALGGSSNFVVVVLDCFDDYVLGRRGQVQPPGHPGGGEGAEGDRREAGLVQQNVRRRC